jgi:hypothetical protein
MLDYEQASFEIPDDTDLSKLIDCMKIDVDKLIASMKSDVDKLKDHCDEQLMIDFYLDDMSPYLLKRVSHHLTFYTKLKNYIDRT